MTDGNKMTAARIVENMPMGLAEMSANLQLQLKYSGDPVGAVRQAESLLTSAIAYALDLIEEEDATEFKLESQRFKDDGYDEMIEDSAERDDHDGDDDD